MGTWGTGIKSNDAFADVYEDFFERYNNGANPTEISEKVIEANSEILDIPEEANSLWFAIALAQWETKSLDPEILKRVEEIVATGRDIALWEESGASDAEIKKRKVVLEKFLAKIQNNRLKPKPRKKLKHLEPIFSTGDCLMFKLDNGNYGGAVVIGSDSVQGIGYNLVVTTRINQRDKPSLEDFIKSEVLIKNFGDWNDSPDITWAMPDLFHKEFAHIYEVVGRVQVDRTYLFEVDEGYPFKRMISYGWRMNTNMQMQLESEKSKPGPSQNMTVLQLITSEPLSQKRWKFF